MIKKTILIASFLILTGCKNDKSSVDQGQPIDNPSNEWQKIISDDNKFRIEFPVKEVEKGINEYFDLNNAEMRIKYYRVNLQEEQSLNLGYSVSFVPFPNLQSESDIKKRYNEQKEYLIETFNAEVHYDKVLTSPDNDGREIFLTVDSSNVKLTYRMHYKSPNFYMLQVFTDSGKGKIFNESIEKFMDSFEFIED